MTDEISKQIKKLKSMSTSASIESKRQIINEFLEKDLNLMLLDSNYVNFYDKKTRSIIKEHGVKIEDFIILDKNMFLLTLKNVKEISNLREILKEIK